MNESKAWIAVAIFVTAFFIGLFFGWFGTTMLDIDNYKVSKYSARQEIFTLPDGSTWQRVRSVKDLK